MYISNSSKVSYFELKQVTLNIKGKLQKTTLNCQPITRQNMQNINILLITIQIDTVLKLFGNLAFFPFLNCVFKAC